MFIKYDLMFEIKRRTIVKRQKSNFKRFVKRQQDQRKEREIINF